ncbi:nascent polypeptide-associated complex subunit alpha, muscle-specific form-like isoform X3 [Crotalus tigris]|uniref:nascent polypeptide-associated complex subunit alpha, muscle-specific form-like isoform X3 n=1 Tax=Crotalus tigris TaxID=88082 RepID=UPI00192F3E81|nr:nascent polypeptide-associated complex subunit alpha, muscle-specific form-like isoform X3 [Crotalus tigris]
MMLSFVAAVLLISVLSTDAQNNIPNPPPPPPPPPSQRPHSFPASAQTGYSGPEWSTSNFGPAGYPGYRDNAYLGNSNSPYPPPRHRQWHCGRPRSYSFDPSDNPGPPKDFSGPSHGYSGPPQGYPVAGTAQQPSPFPAQLSGSAVSPTSGTIISFCSGGVNGTVVVPEATILILQTTLVLPKASLVLPKDSLVLPKASLVLPKATLVQPKATLGLPKATLGLPKAILVLPKASLVVPMATLVLPKASLVLPKAFLVLPKATLGLPMAILVLPKATLFLPMATLFLPKATLLQVLLNNLCRSLLNHLGLLSHPLLAHNNLTMGIHPILSWKATMVQFPLHNLCLHRSCLLPIHKISLSPLLFLVLNILLALLHNLPRPPLFHLVLNSLVIPQCLPLENLGQLPLEHLVTLAKRLLPLKEIKIKAYN